MSSHATLALLQPHSNSHSVQRWSLMLKTSLRAAWRLGVGWMCPAITYHGVVRPPTLGPMFKLTASGNKYFSNNVISIINNCMKFFMTYDCTSPYCYVLHASPWCSVPSHESVRSVSKQIFNRYNLWKSSLLEQWNVFLMKKKNLWNKCHLVSKTYSLLLRRIFFLFASLSWYRGMISRSIAALSTLGHTFGDIDDTGGYLLTRPDLLSGLKRNCDEFVHWRWIESWGRSWVRRVATPGRAPPAVLYTRMGETKSILIKRERVGCDEFHCIR